MTIGLAVGLAGAALLVLFMRHVQLPSEGLYPLRTLAAAGIIYGLASVAHGSGFLAVFIAGLALSELDVPYKRQIQRFHTSLASLGEIVVFVVLGLTVNVGQLFDDRVWLDGLLLAVALAFVARPLGLAPLLAPMKLRLGEKLFIAWGGLKGAVPILLAAFAILAGVDDAQADLRDRVRRRPVLGRRPGRERAVRRVASRRADARGRPMSALAFGLAALLAGSGGLHDLRVTNGSQPFAGDNRLLTTVSPNGDGFRDRAIVELPARRAGDRPDGRAPNRHAASGPRHEDDLVDDAAPASRSAHARLASGRGAPSRGRTSCG